MLILGWLKNFICLACSSLMCHVLGVGKKANQIKPIREPTKPIHKYGYFLFCDNLVLKKKNQSKPICKFMVGLER